MCAYFSRGPNKVKNPYVIKDYYKEYIKDKEGSYNVDFKTYTYIIEKYYKAIAEYLLEGGVYNMPYKLGFLYVVKTRPRKRTSKNTPIDWAATVKYGKVIRFTNDHSNYFKFLLSWNKTECRVMNKTLYRFIPTRDFKRTLAAKIKAGKQDYFEL